MRFYIPFLICLFATFFAASKAGTLTPPLSWYDLLAGLSLVGTVVSFIWGLAQQSTLVKSKRPPVAGYQPKKSATHNPPPGHPGHQPPSPPPPRDVTGRTGGLANPEYDRK